MNSLEEIRTVHECKVCKLYVIRNRAPIKCDGCNTLNSFKTLPYGSEVPSNIESFNKRRNPFQSIFGNLGSNRLPFNSEKESRAKIVDPSKVERKPYTRSPTGVDGLDYVLNGGLAEGYVVISAGPPGAGKSTIFTQAASRIQELGMHYGNGAAYGASEEDEDAIIETADRVAKANFPIVVSTSCEALIEKLDDTYSHTWVIDSLMHLTCDRIDGESGSPSQVTACATMLCQRAHATGPYKGMQKRSLLIVAHGTKDGNMAGPLKAVHAVDGGMIHEHVSPEGNIEKKIPPWFPVEDQTKPTGYVRIRVFRKMRKGSTKPEAYFQMQPRHLDIEETILNPIGGRLDAIDGPNI